ncbi:MAG: CBS domain-containing protein [Candidatus Omnitrophica bacterium]|nr:CBS domain-containing protein [Candidatus Omnitrophota bacterium]
MDQLRLVFENLKVRDIMRTPVITIFSDENLSDALIKFSSFNVSHLVVIDRGHRLVGLFSHKYLYRTQSPRKVIGDDVLYDPGLMTDGADGLYDKSALDCYILEHVMKKNPYYLHPEDKLSKALIDMAQKNLACIPIVDEKMKVKGLVTDHDILLYLAGILEE